MAVVNNKGGKQVKTWLSVANLVVTLLSAIGIAWIGWANNNTQITLASLKHESNFARVETTISCFSTLSNGNCSEILEITNTGQATAKSVKVDISGENQDGLPLMDDVSNFVIHHGITPIDITIKPIKQIPLLSDTQGTASNEYEVDIPNLPPSNVVQLRIAPNSSLFKTYTINSKPITVHLSLKDVSAHTFASNFPVSSVIRKFLEDYYFVKKFQINSFCENCEGQNVSGQPSTLSSNTVNVQGNKGVDSITFSGLTVVDLQRLTAQSLDNSVWTGTVSITYMRPKNWADVQPLPTPLVLYAVMDDLSTSISSSGEYQQVVTLCQGDQCQ